MDDPKQTGKRGKPSKRVRLQDLASQCGVSVATVSRALSGAGGVRPDLAARIQAVASEFSYALPASMAGRRVMVLASGAAMIDYSRSQFTLNVMQGLEDRAALLNIGVLTRAVDTPADEIAALAEAEADATIAGLLFLTLDDAAMLAPTRHFGKPIVLVNGDDPLMQLSSIAPNNRAAGALACDHLLGLGHRRILFVMRRGRRTIERRFEGWRDRMLAEGVHDPGLVVEVDDWLPELAATAIDCRIATQGMDFTAVIGAGDALAIGALQALHARGIEVPGEVSVMGMDGLPQGAFHAPALTAIAMPMREIGAAAVDLLRDLVTGLPLPARRIELACRLVQRASVSGAHKGPLSDQPIVR